MTNTLLQFLDTATLDDNVIMKCTFKLNILTGGVFKKQR